MECTCKTTGLLYLQALVSSRQASTERSMGSRFLPRVREREREKEEAQSLENSFKFASSLSTPKCATLSFHQLVLQILLFVVPSPKGMGFTWKSGQGPIIFHVTPLQIDSGDHD